MRTKSLLTIALAAAGMMYGASVFAAGTTPTTGPFGTGKITFTGTITNSPCDIAPGDDAIAVPLGQISYRHLKAADDVSDSKPFTIHLQNCAFDPDDATTNKNPIGKMSKVTVSFLGNANANNKGYVNTGNAQDVAVQLLKSDNHSILAPNTDADTQQLQTGNNELNFFARVVALGTNVSPGTVESTVTYTLKYL
ncbi:fimbrial protein [Salmonella enterica subsp. enterica]|uniref:Fimbrial protein n=2 Tax=Salmonella enterica TaxID=28901 RepID=A0A759WJM0_SALER|nr:fimbrial protein [Salmonella enterica subsp. enterica serovar Infantis]EBW6041088.1 fimbrial protein [Salmonella enterica subsp. enterica serovar Oranienburg]EDB9284644.1 fimbrial protein [Salmonella enterica]EBH3470602.1 fimbrial protein [Salmonella enterica subsp. enterica serovar Infantis]EBH3488597.1 fimbrial protein [Salmonella enterica subsp. enterica serovar Infantis]